MLSILPISLAQSKAGNDSEKRKTWNKATTLLVALFKKMTETIYNSLINAI